MNNFVKIRIYCEGGKNCCFDTIQKSRKPTILVNTNEISTLEEKTDWGFCDNYQKYPYRRLTMHNGKTYLCVLESANELEQILLSRNEPEKTESNKEEV